MKKQNQPSPLTAKLLSSAADAAREPKLSARALEILEKTGPQILEGESPAPVTRQLFAPIVESIGLSTIISEQEQKQVLGWQAEIDECSRRINEECDDTAARRIWLKQTEDYIAGKISEVQDKDNLRATFRAQRAALKERRKTICKESEKLCCDATLRFSKVVATVAAAREGEEHQTWTQQFGEDVPFEASPLLRSLLRAVRVLIARAEPQENAMEPRDQVYWSGLWPEKGKMK